ncbi:Asp/Glu/hydantoin racemase [Panaeolus papilionaceus]|nr:Asp/Glu/hydantoin racemase [Panaeolus papilionaceus]
MSEDTPVRILVINPNSSSSVTSGLQSILTPPPSTYLNFYTAPLTAPAQIMDLTTGIESAAACYEDLKRKRLIDQYDAFLVCCFSDHPLTHILREQTPKPCMNILEAAISQSLLIGQRFGIITTGTGYKYIYHKDVKNFMGATSDRFAGLVTTGLDVLELGDGERGYVEKKIKDAAKRIAEMGADVIILGCAGMAGMEDWVKQGVEDAGHGPVKIIDGAKAGIQLLPALVRLG